MNQVINFNEPYKTNRIKKYVNLALESNYYSSGEFEHRCKEFLENKYGFKNTFITHSATGALEMSALLIRQNNSKKKVFMPSYTFSSTANAFLRAGFKIEFLDVNKENFMIDLKKSAKIAAGNILVPVHYGGNSIDMDGYTKFKKNGILVEDAAQSLGTTWRNKQVGLFGDMAAVSFHHTKNVQGGFAGLLSVNNDDYFERAKYIYERGTDRSKVISSIKSKYEWVEIGSSFQVPDVISAIVLAQLEEVEMIEKKRKKVYNFYLKYFSKAEIREACSIPINSFNSKTNYHAFFIIFSKKELSVKFLEFTKRNGINCYIGYVPLHTSIMGNELKLNNRLPITEANSELVVRLPIHTNINSEQLSKIESVFNNFFEKEQIF